MSSDDYQVQNIYRYSRKSYKNNRRSSQDDMPSPRDDINVDVTEVSPRSDGHVFDSPRCSCDCDIDPEADLANILHKKCPVISLAQKQLQRLLEESDKLLCDKTMCPRTLYDFLIFLKEILKERKYSLLILIALATFMVGMILGAASCGSYLGRFNSPILTCIENFFISPTTHSFDAIT